VKARVLEVKARVLESESAEAGPARVALQSLIVFIGFAAALLFLADGRSFADDLHQRFSEEVRPALARHCFSCHSGEAAEANLDLEKFLSPQAFAAGPRVLREVRRRIEGGQMPPPEAEHPLGEESRRSLSGWFASFELAEIDRSAGDPGIVLARRLSSAEFDNTIRDLTGVDMRPAREFPVDPANEAGFDNSGESLAMSPALLTKYLAAARQVADRLIFTSSGLEFSEKPAIAETDRDEYFVHKIVAFYRRHDVDLADYFEAAWRFRHREALGRGEDTLHSIAQREGLSGKYLETVWSLLEDAFKPLGPTFLLRKLWRDLPAPADNAFGVLARAGCERMRDLALKMRAKLAPEVERLHAQGMSDGSQPLVLWHNRQSAAMHREYLGSAAEDAAALSEIAPELALSHNDAESKERYQKSLERFCRDVPRAFVVIDRGPYFDPSQANQGRLLTAGFHLMLGYFRDDRPLYELVLGEAEQARIDQLWRELNFAAFVPQRQYKDFIFFERAEPPRFMRDAEFDFARSEDHDSTSETKMRRLAELHVAKAKRIGAGDRVVEAIETYYAEIGAAIRAVELDWLASEPLHQAAMEELAQRAWRRPLSEGERMELRGFYGSLRERDGLSHAEAIRDSLASVLLSPHFVYRYELASVGGDVEPLTPYSLANRLSYFLTASMPDSALLARAASGDLSSEEALLSETRRLLAGDGGFALATEFGAQWLDVRRFEEHNAVDRDRFPQFTPELRQAMFQEPIRFLADAIQNDRSLLDLLEGDYTFVNEVLARHYGMPLPTSSDGWGRIDDAGQYGRGGLLPMAVFQTANSPGLRTSPVKRGYWVVRRLLGETIPPPPPTVPELPPDEAAAGELSLPRLLARHREDKACAGCHDRFDAIGLAFEGYGPIGEERTHDLGGRRIENLAAFPGGGEGRGLEGLKSYLREHRQAEFIDNFCRKLCAYALGRGLLLSDETLIAAMKARLARDEYRLRGAFEEIVVSKQFRYRRQ
jgi:hypothetical protein